MKILGMFNILAICLFVVWALAKRKNLDTRIWMGTIGILFFVRVLIWGYTSLWHFFPLIFFPAIITLALVHYKCPNCSSSLTNKEFKAKECPRCGSALQVTKPSSITRITAFVTLVGQWIGVTAAYLSSQIAFKAFSILGLALPGPTVLAINFSNTSGLFSTVIITLSVCTTLCIIGAEITLKSEKTRFTIQVVNLGIWLILATSVMLSLFLPFAELEKF
jgi:uncharacterized paraquat-inducible protein A